MIPIIGTAGWSIPARYAKEVPQIGSQLERYAHRLNGVEINSSFYKSHRAETYHRWARSTPDGFRFAVKAPRAITHDRKLVDCDELLESFAAEVGGLGHKLGVILVQLPPSLVFEYHAIESFSASFSARLPASFVFEPRHVSWFTTEVDHWLDQHRIPRVGADPPIGPNGDEPGGWLGLRYYRRHGSPRIYFSNYDDISLGVLNTSFRQQEGPGAPLWCIFDNTASGAALGNALTVTKLVEAKSENGAERELP
jgi:uncharacterized protein YecE (DUF72 family)